MTRFEGLLGGIVSAGGAIISSLCCVLPLAIVLLGLGSGAFMATTMQYSRIFVPIGIVSVGAGFYLHFREKRRCTREGCAMAGGAWNLALLTLSAVVVATAIFFTMFPATSADLLMWATSKQGGEASQTMDMPMGSTR